MSPPDSATGGAIAADGAASAESTTVLVINCGSSSLKYALFDAGGCRKFQVKPVAGVLLEIRREVLQ